MLDCFDVRLIAGEVALLYVAFAGAPVLPLAIVLVTTLTALLARDAYIHPARGTAREAVSDAVAGATFLVLAQTFMAIIAPTMVMEGPVMLRGDADRYGDGLGVAHGLPIETPGRSPACPVR